MTRGIANHTLISLGLELEGGMNNREYHAWNAKWGTDRDLHVGFTTDGSVHVSGKEIYDLEIQMWCKVGDKRKMFRAVKDLYDKGFEANDSCGVHVHFIWDNMEKAVSIISFEKYWKDFINRYVRQFKDNDKYMKRLANHFCSADYSLQHILSQINTKDYKAEGRYKAINLNSYNIHGTVEFRLLPHMDSAEELESAVRWIKRTATNLLSHQCRTNIEDQVNVNIEEVSTEGLNSDIVLDKPEVVEGQTIETIIEEDEEFISEIRMRANGVD